jgi:hypothetical protein
MGDGSKDKNLVRDGKALPHCSQLVENYGVTSVEGTDVWGCHKSAIKESYAKKTQKLLYPM